MSEDNILEFVPTNWVTSDSTIKVIGVGGAGCNAVNNMFNQKIQGCSFYVCNTDSQALSKSPVPNRIQLGKQGYGAGCDPIKGRNAALESQDTIDQILDKDTQMVFVTAGMGGGTGTGAAPVIAKIAKDKGILTIAVITMPFSNEGDKAMTRAVDGINELEKNVDSMLIINNEKLYEVFGDQLTQDAFPQADNVLLTAVKSIIEIIKKPGYINVDFQDVKTMMRGSGMALMGIGSGKGKNRLEDAVHSAFESPLLNDFDLKTAKNVLTNITSGKNEQGITMSELGQINKMIDEYTGSANKFKSGLIWDEDPNIGDQIFITAIATGFKFIKLIDPQTKTGNLIIIHQDFEYKREDSLQDGIPLYEDENAHISFMNSDHSAKLHIDLDERPALLVREGDDISELENIPAIRRIQL